MPRLSGRDMLLAKQSEQSWLEHVMRLADRGGWHGYHVPRSSIREASGRVHGVYYGIHYGAPAADHDDRKGIPDLLLVQPERHILLMPELKAHGGRVDDDQKRWNGWLAQVEHVAAPIWFPTDEATVRDMLLGTG